MSSRLAGRVAVVTAAGSGIGQACARRYAAEGAQVVVNSFYLDSCEAVADEIGGIAFPGDVSDPAVVDALIGAAAALGRLDIVHNNAADTRSGLVADLTDDEWRHVMSLTLDSVFFGIRAALRHMVPQGSGVILATTSSSGLGGVAGFGAYGAAKAGVENLVRVAAIENARHGIRVNAVCPGTIESRSSSEWFESRPEQRERYAAQIPQQRLGVPEEVANVAAFLVSDEASYVNGATFVVDGGVAAQVALPK